MSEANFEALLARIYVDPGTRERFLANPTAEDLVAGLSQEEIEALKQIDRAGLELFAASLEIKRSRRIKCV